MTELSFEKALKDLENIVGKLEEGNPTLGESLALFEKGVKLARYLKEELDKAEKKTEILLKNEEGTTEPQPFVLNSESSDSGDEESSQGGDADEDLPF